MTLATLYGRQNRWDEALACYELAVHYHEHDSWFWHNYGEALLNINDYQEAIAAFERVLVTGPSAYD